MIICEKIIDLDAEVGVSAMKILVGLVFEIYGDNGDTEIDLIEVSL